MRIRLDKSPRTLCDALLPGPRPPIRGTGPYLLVYLNKGKAPGVECKWPRTLREGLLPGPPIGEMSIRSRVFGTNGPIHFVMPSSPDLQVW